MDIINTDTKKIEEFIVKFDKDIIEYRNNITELFKIIKNISNTSWNGQDQEKYTNYCLSFEDDYLAFAETLESYLKLYSDVCSVLNNKITNSNIGGIE